jgi:hypothetical protein
VRTLIAIPAMWAQDCVVSAKRGNRHHVQKVNIAIKMLWDKVNVSNKFT